MSNNFDGPVLLDDGVSTTVPVAVSAYFGFGRTGTGSQSTGPRIIAGVGTPDTLVTAPLGSLWLQSDSAGFFRNTDGATAWTAV